MRVLVISHISKNIRLQVFRTRTPQDAIELVSQLLKYTPSARPTPFEALAHEFFDELRLPTCKMPSTGGSLPPLFDFTEHELKIQPNLNDKLIPKGQPQQPTHSSSSTNITKEPSEENKEVTPSNSCNDKYLIT